MREPINENTNLPDPGDVPVRKSWDAPTWVRLDADCAEANINAGADVNGSAS